MREVTGLILAGRLLTGQDRGPAETTARNSAAGHRLQGGHDVRGGDRDPADDPGGADSAQPPATP